MEINGNNYSFSKMNALQQFHVARRIQSLIFSGKKMSLQGFSEALSKMSDEEAEAVLFPLLKSVQRENSRGGGFAPIMSEGNLMFSDIDLKTLIQLAWKALEVNFSDFFTELKAKAESGFSKEKA